MVTTKYKNADILTQEIIDLSTDFLLLKNLNGKVIECNQSYLAYRKTTLKEASSINRPEFLSSLQWDFLQLAHKHFVGSSLRQFNYQAFGEVSQLDVQLSIRKFSGQTEDLVLVSMRPVIKEAQELELPPILTPREYDVLQLLLEGNSQKRIAQHLGLSPHTVGEYLKNVYSKLKVTSSTQAVQSAIIVLGMTPRRRHLGAIV